MQVRSFWVGERDDLLHHHHVVARLAIMISATAVIDKVVKLIPYVLRRPVKNDAEAQVSDAIVCDGRNSLNTSPELSGADSQLSKNLADLDILTDEATSLGFCDIPPDILRRKSSMVTKSSTSEDMVLSLQHTHVRLKICIDKLPIATRP
jgi:hypothetical protein